MVTYLEALEIVQQLIADQGRGFDWYSYRRHRYDISEEAKHLAIRLLDTNKELADSLRQAIGIELKCRPHRDYVYRVLALVLDEDSYGNHITRDMLLIAKRYRMEVLGISY